MRPPARSPGRRTDGGLVTTLAIVLPALAAAGCADHASPTAPATPGASATTPRPDVVSVAVVPDSANPLQAWVRFTVTGADSARVLYRVGAGPQRTTVERAVRDSARVTLLDIAPGDTVVARVVAYREGVADTSAAAASAPALLPDVVRRVRLATTAGRLSAGYVLTALTLGDTGYAVAFDTAGQVAWYRAFPGVAGALDAYQQPNGDVTIYLLGSSHGFDPATGSYAEVRPSGALVRQWAAPAGFYTDPHELRVGAGPGGTTYLFGYNFATTDLTARGGAANASVAAHTIFRVDAAGNASPVFAARDHFTAADWVDPEPGVTDLDHPNSIDVDRDGGLVVSWRNVDEVSEIDPATGQFVWRLGGPHNQFTFVNDPLGGFGGQHCARVLADGDLLLYDNGTTHAPQETRAAEYRLDLAAHTATLVWQFRHQPAVFTPFIGSVQRLASGSTFVDYAYAYAAAEVAPDGAVAWEGKVLVDGAAPAYPSYRLLKIRSLARYAAP